LCGLSTLKFHLHFQQRHHTLLPSDHPIQLLRKDTELRNAFDIESACVASHLGKKKRLDGEGRKMPQTGKEDAAERNEEDGESEGRQWEDKEEDKADDQARTNSSTTRLSRLMPSRLDGGEKAS
jgi:hypothetical protein